MNRDQELENRDSVAQKRRKVLKILANHDAVFRRQGSVQATWRAYRGKKLGPFYRLVYRQGGRQLSLYLGSGEALAEEVRQELKKMQTPLREQQRFDRELAQIRAGFRKEKREFDQVLRRLGLRLQGNEIRGRRRLRDLLPFLIRMGDQSATER